MRESYWIKHHPVQAGLIAGGLFCCVAVVMMALFPRCPIEWPLLAMVAWGFGRPVSAGAAVLAPVCLVCSVFSGVSIFSVMIPVITALVLAHLLTRCEEVPRWGGEHLGYVFVLSIVYYLVLFFFISVGTIVWSVSVYALIIFVFVVFLLTKRMVRPFQSKPGEAAYRFNGRG
jgi:hypothetical protein